MGVLGGYTTFSSFSVETVNMLQRGDWGLASVYVLTSVIGAILMVIAGLALARVVA